ncbi:hypothetical protein C0991_002635, partial [Blastosporella zonata]
MSYQGKTDDDYDGSGPYECVGKLGPATFGEPAASGSGGGRDHSCSSTPKGKPLKKGHWSLMKDIDPSKYGHLLRLPHKLAPSNYITWITMIESNLNTVDLFKYCLGKVPKPEPKNEDESGRWKHTNALVCAILTTNMTEEVVNQIGHYQNSQEIWTEAGRLFAGHTLTDWTLTITNM